MTTIAEIQPDKYMVETELSRDEWSTLYRARRKSDDAVVVLRVVTSLFAGDEFFVRRLKQIIDKVLELKHPNLWRVLSVEREDTLLYLVQDFAELRSLNLVIESEGPFSPQRMQFIAAQIASVLDYAHAKSIMHGNLSAHNIYLGSGDHVLVDELGLAQALYGYDLLKHKPTGAPKTLAPERIQGQGPSRHSDLYSLGILCYQMLAKQPPFSGPASMVLHAQAYRQPRPLHRVNPGIPLAVSEAVGRMLAKSVDVRYSTGAEFVRALAVAARSQTSAHQYDHLIPLVERTSRRRLTAQTLGYLCSALVILSVSVGLAIWAGYELGLKHATTQPPPRQIIFASPGLPSPEPTGTHTSDDLTAFSITPASDTATSSPPTADRSLSTLSDTLFPTPSPTLDSLLPPPTRTPTATPQPTPTVFRPPAVAVPVSAPAIPTGQGLLIFHNPTGHDLVIDLTGPSSMSELVPPYSEETFALAVGRYQVMIHTPTGDWLASRTLHFELPEGQIVEKDYYSDYDLMPQ